MLLVLIYNCYLIMPSSSISLMFRNTRMLLNSERLLMRQRQDFVLNWIKVVSYSRMQTQNSSKRTFVYYRLCFGLSAARRTTKEISNIPFTPGLTLVFNMDQFYKCRHRICFFT